MQLVVLQHHHCFEHQQHRQQRGVLLLAGKLAADSGLIAQMAGVDKPQRLAQGGRGTRVIFEGLQGDGGADVELAVLLLNLAKPELVK